jgi:hypothetical protein
MTRAGVDYAVRGYTVTYFDAVLSRASKGGVRVRTFMDRVEAERFAAANRLYARSCTVKVVTP